MAFLVEVIMKIYHSIMIPIVWSMEEHMTMKP